MTRRACTLAALVTSVVVLTACSGGATSRPAGSPSDTASPDAAACNAVAADVLRATQRYVDGYGSPLDAGPEEAEAGPGPTATGDTELRSALRTARADLQRHRCDVEDFQRGLRNGLQGITARGAVARAVLLQLEASMTGSLGSRPETRSVSPGDDLARTLAQLAPGSTVRLAAGSYRVDETLVLLNGVTLRGAGRGRTTVESAAADAAVLVLTDGRVELADMAVRHTGNAPASVLIGGPSSSVVLTGVRITGARSGKGGDGGTGVLMSARDGEAADRGTTLEVTDAQFTRNAAAGILLGGGHRASIVGSTFRGNGQCGVCFAGASGGAVRDSRFPRNDVGVAVVDAADPALTGNTYTGGEVAVQASGKAAPVVRRATVTGAARAAMIFSGKATGRVDGAVCSDVPFGIVVAPGALPYIGDNDCPVARSR